MVYLTLLIQHWKRIAVFFAILFLAGVMGYTNHNAYKRGIEVGKATMQVELDGMKKYNTELERANMEQAINYANAVDEIMELYQQDKDERDKKEKVRYVESQKVVEKPIYRNDCIDADGLQLINRAIQNK